MTDDQNIKAYMLANIENNINLSGAGYIPIKYDKKIIDNITEPLKISRDKYIEERIKNIKNVGILKDKSIIIIDEFDSLIDPLKSDLNFPIGLPINVDEQNFLAKIILTITSELFKNFKGYMLKSDRSDETVNKLIIKNAMSNIDKSKYKELANEYNLLYQKYIKKMQSNNVEQFRPLSEKEIKDINNKKGGSRDSLLLYYIREVYNIYYRSLQLMQDKDYGFCADNENIKNPFIAIPYSAQDTPMKGSQYSNMIICMILTSITYCSKKFRDIDTKKYIEFIKYCHTRWGMGFLVDKIQINEKIINFALMDKNKDLQEYINYLHNRKYNEYVDTIITYLDKVILLKYINVNPEILNCSFIDIIDPDYIKAKLALSGTVNVHLPQFEYYGNNNVLKKVIHDTITTKKIDAGLRGNNMAKERVVIKRIKIDANTDDIIKIMHNYDVLIDVGSFLRHNTNIEIAEKMSKIYIDNYIIYFDDNDKPRATYNNENVEYNMNDLKYERKYKVYFDQKHTIGTDLDIGSSAKSLTTINKLNTYTQAVQGLFRMREINYYQTNDFIIKYDLANEIDNFTKLNNVNQMDALSNILKKNEDNKYNISEYKFLQQTIYCYLRRLHEYVAPSYKQKSFIPSYDITNEIEMLYNFDYSKNNFIEYVKNELSEINRENETNNMIINEINKLTNRIKDIKENDTSNTIQKQSDVSKEMKYETNYERNYKINYNNERKCKINTVKYNNFFNQLECQNNCYMKDNMEIVTSGKSKEPNIEMEMIKYLRSLNVKFSPYAFKYMFAIITKGDQKLLYLHHNKYSNIWTVLTPEDIVIIKLYLEHELVNIKLIDRYDNNPINNLLMLMNFMIPHEMFFDDIKNMDMIMNAKDKIIRYYDNFFQYKLDSVSPGFEKILKS